MTDERNATASLSEDELAGLSAEALPDRKAMSTITCDPSEFAGVASGELIPPPEEEQQPGTTVADS